MEVSRRRILQKHLEPARPLRRVSVDQEQNRSVQTFHQMEDKPINNIGVEQFYKILQLGLHTQNLKETPKVRICYSREILLQLASSPVAKRKPDNLPEHPVVLVNPPRGHRGCP